MLRGAAVQWTRAANGTINVAAVKDFGIEPMSTTAQRYFAQNLPDGLPGIPPAAWAQNRHTPLAPQTMDPPPLGGVLTADAASEWILDQDHESTLYTTSTAPTISFSGVELATRLHNLPPNAIINDLVVDLANVLFHTMRGVSFHK